MENDNDRWERDVLRKLLQSTLDEQRRARRWKIFFRLAVLALIAGVLLAASFQPQGMRALGRHAEHTALVKLEGIILDGAPASGDRIVRALEDAFDNANSKGVVLHINSPGGSPVQSAQINDAIRRLRDLPRRVAATDRGTEVTVNVWRDGAARDITVTIAGRDDDAVAATGDLGMTLRDTGGDGVTVAEVAADSISARHGIRAGDMIIRAGTKPARRASDVRAAITDARKQKRKSVVLLIARGGDDGGRFVALPVS